MALSRLIARMSGRCRQDRWTSLDGTDPKYNRMPETDLQKSNADRIQRYRQNVQRGYDPSDNN